MKIPGEFAVIVVNPAEVGSTPVYEYEDNERTDRQKVDEDGNPLWAVRGVAPLVGGEIVVGGTVHVTREFEGNGEPVGTTMPVKGSFTPRPAPRGSWGVTGTLVVDEWLNSSALV